MMRKLLCLWLLLRCALESIALWLADRQSGRQTKQTHTLNTEVSTSRSVCLSCLMCYGSVRSINNYCAKRDVCLRLSPTQHNAVELFAPNERCNISFVVGCRRIRLPPTCFPVVIEISNTLAHTNGCGAFAKLVAAR